MQSKTEAALQSPSFPVDAFPGLKKVWGSVAVLLCGSETTGFADGYSGRDYLIITPDSIFGEVLDFFPRVKSVDGQAEVRLPRDNQGKVSIWPYSLLQERVARYDDLTLFTLRHARPLHDPSGLVTEIVNESLNVPEGVWREKAVERYRLFRQRKASMAWALRRGQPLVFLDSFLQALTHALSLCYYVEGLPPANRKWLFRGALRTKSGQNIRPVFFDLLSSLGDAAVLGGSYTLRHNNLYGLLGRLQATLEQAMHNAWDMPEQEGNNLK